MISEAMKTAIWSAFAAIVVIVVFMLWLSSCAKPPLSDPPITIVVSPRCTFVMLTDGGFAIGDPLVVRP